MKVLFSADLHIRVGQKNVPADWQRNRFKKLFKDYASVYAEHDCNLMILGGDIFDKLPNMDELELYFDLLAVIRENSIRTIIYPGNHEAVRKNTTFLSHLKGITNTSTLGYAKIVDEFHTEDGIDYIPYNRLKEYYPGSVDFHSKILCTHVRGEIPPHVKPEVPLELFDRWDLVLAGDLHSHSNSQRNIVYPGSPVTTSFHRTETTTGVLVVDTSSLKYVFVELDMPQLIRKTVTDPAEMVRTEFHHTIYELEGDIVSTSAKVESDLLDKKIVYKESKESSDLSRFKTVQEELSWYLSEVTGLKGETLSQAMLLFNDKIKVDNLE